MYTSNIEYSAHCFRAASHVDVPSLEEVSKVPGLRRIYNPAAEMRTTEVLERSRTFYQIFIIDDGPFTYTAQVYSEVFAMVADFIDITEQLT